LSLPTKGLFAASLEDVMACLPAMERVMVIARAPGITHERIGAVAAVTHADGWLQLSGPHHSARIKAERIRSIRFNRSSGMKDRVLPRIEFLDGAGEVVFALVALAGLDDFDVACAGLAFSGVPEPEPTAREERAVADLDDDDPAVQPFRMAMEGQWQVGIGYRGKGFVQDWSGVIAQIRPAMGFWNIMTPDFHLHLAARGVDRWRQSEDTWQALDGAGSPLGLELRRVAS